MLDLALFRDARQSFVCPNRRVLKLPRLLTAWWRSVPLKLPGESCRKRSCNDAQGVLGELGILLGGFRESKAVQLRVDLNRLHATIIPSCVEAPSLPDTVRDATSWPDDGSRLSGPLPTAPLPGRLAAELFYQVPNWESWMVIPRADSSSSNLVTAGDISPSPGTTTAHSKFSRNSRDTIRHRLREGGVVAPT